MDKAYSTINEILVGLFNEIMDIEEKAVITDEFKDISNHDMHIIEAIGRHSAQNMSATAKAIGITVGTLTIAINNLVKKGYVRRVRSDQDRRVVLVFLTPKGQRAFDHHKRFHENMVEATVAGLNEADKDSLLRALTNLKNFFTSMAQSPQS